MRGCDICVCTLHRGIVVQVARSLNTLLAQIIEEFPTQGLFCQQQIMHNGVASTAFEQARPTPVVQRAVERIEKELVGTWYDAGRLESSMEFPDPLLELLARHNFDRREKEQFYFACMLCGVPDSAEAQKLLGVWDYYYWTVASLK